jgi:hypothetical protein
MRRNCCAIVLLLASMSAAPSFAGNTDNGTWNEFGLRAALPDSWYLLSNVQFRFRDNFSDFYWFRWEVGPGFKPAPWLDVNLAFRVNPTERNGRWSNQNYIFLNPVFRLYSKAGWTTDLRTTLHQKLDVGRSYFRVRPRVSRAFKAGTTASTWYVYDEVRFETTDLKGKRDRLNYNWFATGFIFRLYGNTDLGLGYLLESSQGANGKWSHLNVLNTSLIYRF